MRWLIRLFIRLYRMVISPMLPRHCRFHPSCSAYAQEAFERYPLRRASVLTVKRLAKCHPWHAGGYDPLPESQPTHQHDEACRPNDGC